jgi:hypothetical protein
MNTANLSPWVVVEAFEALRALKDLWRIVVARVIVALLVNSVGHGGAASRAGTGTLRP